VAISWTDVVAIAPELDVVPTASQERFLAISARQIDPDVWGEFADDGQAYLAAHLASIRDDTGLITAESMGPFSRTYDLPPGVMGSLALSTYGAEYDRLLQIVTIPAFLVP